VPDFYGKLYSLFALPVLRSNYRERFFRYSADFLASTHLPEYLVAAFAKKLARLSLLAPAPVIPLICQFITNLMISHPGLKILIHNTKAENVKSMEDDPFDDEELDPSKTRAMESSLWEMKTLQNHALPSVAQACSFIEKQISDRACDLDEVFSNDYDTMFTEETVKKKNIDQVEATGFGPFDFVFGGALKTLADSVCAPTKRMKT
jgi:U3 small nucleolar RNA-associated protein 19